MNDVKRICAFYSRGPHFAPMLKRLRKDFPHAHITAMVPLHYPPEAAENADEIIETPLPAYSLRHIAPILHLARAIRGGRYDLFAVMFDSAKLRLLARASGAPLRYCHTIDGRLISLKGSLLVLFVRNIWRRIIGEITYARIRYIVHHRPTEVEKAEGKETRR